MSIIAKMVAMLGLDSVAFDAGMNRARQSTRAFGADIQKVGGAFESVNLAGAFMKIHTAARIMRQSADFGTVLVRGLREQSLAWSDLADAAEKLPIGVGEAIKAVAGLGYEITGDAAAVRKLTAETGLFVIKTSNLVGSITKLTTLCADLRAEYGALGAAAQGPDASARFKAEEAYTKKIAAIRAAAEAPGGVGMMHPSTLEALGLAGAVRSSALAAIVPPRPAGMDEWDKVQMAWHEITESAEEYRRIELLCLGIDRELVNGILAQEAATRKITDEIERQGIAIDAAYPDFDLMFFDQYLAGQKELADQAEALTKSLRSPWQVLQDEVDQYTLLLEKDLITQEEFNAAVLRAGKGAVEAAGGLSPNRGQAAVWTERRQYGALQGDAQTVPSLLRQQLKEAAKSNAHLQKLVDSGGLG